MSRVVHRALLPIATFLLISFANEAAAGPPQGSRDGTMVLAVGRNQDPTVTSEKTTITTVESSTGSWTIDGPISLRSADPTECGEVEIKNIFGWATTKGADDDDDWEYELEVEWGIAEDHELILEMPWEIGDGRIDGNGDLTLGWHWRLWRENGSMPAFAMRNYVRIPSGVDSSGVDYELRGLITKTLIDDCLRLHVNPFARSVNGNNEEDARNFQWGALLGVDYRLSDTMLLIADYRYENGEEEHTRDNHTAEFGADWKLDECQKLGFVLEVGLDGDSHGTSLGAKISYILSFGG